MTFFITEHTLRQELLRALEEDVSNLHLKVFDELAFRVRGEVRRIPDIVILKEGGYLIEDDLIKVEPNGIIGIIETKKLEISEGMAQVAQYQSLLRTSYGAAKYVASTDFKKLWIHDDGTGNYLLHTYEKIKEISHEIYSIMSSGLAHGKGELTEDDYVKSLGAAVDELTPYTSQIDPTVTERLTGIFLARTLDIEVGKNKSISDEVANTSRSAASFILVNQMFFYHILSGGNKPLFEPISLPTNLRDLQVAFDNVKQRDFESIYAARIVELLGLGSIEVINGVMEQMRLMKVDSMSSDIIGKVFHSLIPFHLRKRIAAYYTGNPAAHLLSLVCISDPNDRVADLACGSGTMLVEAYKRLKGLYHAVGVDNCERHFKILSQLYGVDITLFAGQLAAMNLFIQQLDCFPELIQIAIEDAFNLRPAAQTILPVQETVKTDFVTTSGRIKLPKSFNSIMINPPFTDRRRIRKQYIEALDKTMSNLNRSEYVTGQFHLGLYFILLCEAFLAEGGFMGIVIPESVLGNVAITGFRRFITEKFHIYALITSTAQIAYSHNCDWKEVLLVLRRGSRQSGEKTRIVNLRKELSYSDGEKFAKCIKEGNVPDESRSDISISLEPEESFAIDRNWLRLLRPEGSLDELEAIAGSRLIESRRLFWREN